MKLKNIIYKGILFVGFGMLLTACDDWLDVKPKSQVEDSELFESETGFKEALAGVYSSMVNENTYSKELIFGAMGVLGHEWDGYPAQYESIADYDYSVANSENIIRGIWEKSYNSIANVNNLLNHIEGSENLFFNNNYSIIKGEALALRAFLHFDLLRCFGVSYAVNNNMPSIPYCTGLTYRVFPQLSVKEVAESIEKDLLEAEKLLKVDPILTGEEITELVDNGYLLNRQIHMNYYAVKGLQARLYMWMQKYSEAKACAETIINSEKFTWATEANMNMEVDLSLVTEQVFALQNVNLSQLNDTYFNLETASNTFSISFAAFQELYERETLEYRYVHLFEAGKGDQEGQMYIEKFKVTDQQTEDYYKNKISLIRLAEIYFIKAECEYRENNVDAYKTLNEVRSARNLTTLYKANPTNFYEELVREYRKDLVGEGQVFFLCKRLNLPSIVGSSVDMIGAKAYTFPLPISETDAAQRKDNR